jgi:hypothetical protein
LVDLAVAYRIYPGVSGPSRGLPFDDDKLHQAELCVRSFRRCTSGLSIRIWAIMDSCPSEYEAMFRRYFTHEELSIVHLESAGNHGTFAKQISILLEQTDAESVYFAEDDYLYLEKDFGALLRLMRDQPDVDFISPWDHPDDHTLALHNFPKIFLERDGLLWRSAASTCLTFLTTKTTLKRYEKVFRTYSRGNFDFSIWLAITKLRIFNPFARFLYDSSGTFFMARGVLKAWFYGCGQIVSGKRGHLWVPEPTFALHLARACPTPGYDLATEMIDEDRRS